METSLGNFSCFRGVAKLSTVKGILVLDKDKSTSWFGKQSEEACIGGECDFGSQEVRAAALGLSHLMYVLKSKFVTALIPLYSIAAMS